jgi:hypothetical protein
MIGNKSAVIAACLTACAALGSAQFQPPMQEPILVDPIPVKDYKPPVTCLGSLTDCATCPDESLCTDISIGRIPGQNQTNNWITDACACICPGGAESCIEIDSEEAEAAIQAARDATREAFSDAISASRTAFANALNATLPPGIEEGSDEAHQYLLNQTMDALLIHRNETLNAFEASVGPVQAAWDALVAMFGHVEEPAAEDPITA